MYIKYDKNGYIQIPELLKCGMPFIFVTGGRGTGKTYGALSYVLDYDVTFMWMRRTQNETDIINKPEFQPFKVINRDQCRNIQPRSISKGSVAFVDADIDTETPLGYTCALSTIANLRGFDASDVDLIVYDEFIPEKHKMAMKAEGEALANAYETINRNRELNGSKPVQLLALSNANRMDNEIFMFLGITEICDNMKKECGQEYLDPERGLAVFMLDNSPLSDMKRETALYKLTENTEFSEMALDNTFNDYTQHKSIKRNLTEYVPVALIGDLALYRHKSNRRYYVTRKKAGVFKAVYSTSETDKLAFVRQYPLLFDLYLKHKIDFSDFTSEALFKRIY